MAQPQRPPPRTRSSTALSSSSASSSLPGSPGPSVSIRDARSTTPTVSARNSPRPGYLTARTMSMNSSVSSAGPSTSKAPRPGHVRDRSTSNLSVATSSASTRTAAHHNRRQQALMGGNSNSKLSRSHLATYNSATGMGRSDSRMASPPVPDILINGAERPEDVDIGSIGRLPSLSAASPVRSSPEATSIGVDGLFAKFGVKEVRSIAQRGRAKAENKREELRTMVGERYRDLLGAADSIVRMRRSSSVLLDRLTKARQECDREAMLSRAVQEDITRSRIRSGAATPLISGHTPYSIATLVKLLLDCPEHIWHCIEKQDYLSAARLDSIGRAVYRELISAGKRKAVSEPRRRKTSLSEEDDEDSGGYDSDEESDDGGELLAAFPLVEQQFDVLDGLAPQISSRASSHLQFWDVTVSTVAEVLATLLMLDRILVADGLDLLLERRSKTLATVLEGSPPLSSPNARRPSTMPTTSSPTAITLMPTGSQSRQGEDQRQAVNCTIEALSLILATHEHVIQCFEKSTDAEESRLVHLLRLLQQSNPSSAESPNTTLSMMHVQTSNPAPYPNSPQPILATLPNAHLFLRYLPEQILTFTPYIDVDSAVSALTTEDVRESMNTWFSKALQTFESGVGRLFSDISTASELADARRTIRESFANQGRSGDAMLANRIGSLERALDAALGQRYIGIYTSKLDHIIKIVPDALEDALRALEASPEDSQPNSFLFSASLPFPSSSIFSSTSSSGIAVSSIGRVLTTDPFTLFKQAIELRVSGRSPILAGCLLQLESLALQTKTDMLAWLNDTGDSKAKDAYISAARQSLSCLEEILRDKLGKQENVKSQLFIGSIAAHVAMNSNFMQALLLLQGSEDLPEGDKASLLQVEESSKRLWRESSVKKAADYLRTSLLDLLDFPPPRDASRPAGCILDTLGLLVDAANHLGTHRSQAVPSGVRDLLQDFEKALLSTVFDADFIQQIKSVNEAQRPALARHLQADIALLREVLGSALGRTRNNIAEQWETIDSALMEISSGDGGPNEQQKSRDVFLRTQNLLAPLLATASYQSQPDNQEIGMLLLPFGTAPAASASEGMLDLAKPGPKLALLPVNAAAA